MDRAKTANMQDEHYEPLLASSGLDKALPDSTILVAIPANMQPGDTISTNMLRQRSYQGTLLDVEAPVTGFPISMDNRAMSAPIPGSLVFLPDLPSTVQLWHDQRLIMVVWLISSVISLVLFAPLFMASGLFLAAEIAAVMGVIAAIVQLCEKEIASSNTMELGAQIKLVATCGTVAAFLDGFTILLDAMLLWKMACDPTDTVCMAVSKYAFVFALGCGHHGIISYMVAQRANSIMPLLNPVSSGAVQL